MPSSTATSVTIISKCRVYPDQTSVIDPLKLSVSDLPMLSCQYIQKGVLLTRPPLPFPSLLPLLKRALSATLSIFPPLAGCLSTDAAGHVSILCNDTGVDFVAARADRLSLRDVLAPASDVPDAVRRLFAYDRTLSYAGHSLPLAAVQVTELADGLFVGCTVNHSAVDGTSLWQFFNTFAAATKAAANGGKAISPKNLPCFNRDTPFDSPAVLRLPAGGPRVTFSGDEQLRERIFHFSREDIVKLKNRANNRSVQQNPQIAEIMGKESNDGWKIEKVPINPRSGDHTGGGGGGAEEISSFQSLCAQLWRSVTRARRLDAAKTTTFRMAVNCRHRVEPGMHAYYFGNAIQSIPTVAAAGELLARDLRWCAGLLRRNVAAHGDATVRRGVAEWEREPRLFPLGNFDGAMITMGSSPRFPMYDNDFGWGRPAAVRSGRANKFDGKISAFPGREGGGSVDLEVVLSPATMAGLETDAEFMQYVT